MTKKLELNENKLKVLKVKDKTDKLTVTVNRLFDIPFRLILCAKTGGSKGTIITNLFLNENYGYTKIFSQGSQFYIFAPDAYSDEKMKILIEEKQIEDSNIFNDIDDLEDLYDLLVEDFKQRIMNDEPIEFKVIIVDDLSFSAKFQSRFNALQKLYCNSRKYMISLLTTNQAYTQVAKNIRLQASGMIIGQTSNKELTIIEEENNYLKGGKKAFFKMFRDNVKERYDFIVINYSNNYDNLYLDKNFRPLAEEPHNEKDDESVERLQIKESSQQQQDKKN